METPSGYLKIDRVGDLLVVQGQGGESVTLSAAAGVRRATLVGPKGPIDRYTFNAGVVRGALVGPSKVELVSVDIATGKTRWKRAVAGLTMPYDEYELRDTLRIVSAGPLDVIAFRHRRSIKSDTYAFQWQEIIAGLNPKNGREAWRRTIRRWPVDEHVGESGGSVLVADGNRVLAIRTGRIETFSGKTGAPGWTFDWSTSSGPVFAAAPGRIALHGDGPIGVRIVDTSNGREIAALPAVEGKIAALAWLSDHLCWVFHVDNRGAAACFAVENGETRELWRRSFKLGPTQVLADARTLFVTVGSDRLVALEASTGKELWTVPLPRPMQLWIARDNDGNGQLFLHGGGNLMAVKRDETLPPGSLPPYLRYVVALEGERMCKTTAVEWIDGEERTVWRHELPSHIAEESVPCDHGSVQAYLRAPRFGRAPGFRHLEAAGVVWVYSGCDLMGLESATGARVFNTKTPCVSPLAGSGFFFDDGSFTFGQCKGPARHAQVFTLCGDELLLFNGLTAAVIDPAARKEKARGQYSRGQSRHGGKAAEFRAQIPLGEKVLELVGLIYMR